MPAPPNPATAAQKLTHGDSPAQRLAPCRLSRPSTGSRLLEGWYFKLVDPTERHRLTSSPADSWVKILLPPTRSSRLWTASPAARPITASHWQRSGPASSIRHRSRPESLHRTCHRVEHRNAGSTIGGPPSVQRRLPMAGHLALARHHGSVCVRPVHGVLPRSPELRPRDPRALGGGRPGGRLPRRPGLYREGLGTGVSPRLDLAADEPLRPAGHLPHCLGRSHPLARHRLRGFIVGFWWNGRLYRFATYTGAQVERLEVTPRSRLLDAARPGDDGWCEEGPPAGTHRPPRPRRRRPARTRPIGPPCCSGYWRA